MRYYKLKYSYILLLIILLSSLSFASITIDIANYPTAELVESNQLHIVDNIYGTDLIKNTYGGDLGYVTSLFQNDGNSDWGVAFSGVGDNQYGLWNVFHKTRSTDGNTNKAVQVGDDLGRLQFVGDTGYQYVTGAEIISEVSKVPANNQISVDLVFTTTNQTYYPVERLRIKSSGESIFSGDLNQTSGNAYINNIYAEMYGKNDNGFVTVSIPLVDTYYQITNFTEGNLNGFTYSNSNLTALYGGMYKVSFTGSGSDGASGQHGFKLYVNNMPQENCYDQIHDTTTPQGIGFDCIVRINATNIVNVRVDDHSTPAGNEILYSANLNIVRIGN